MRFYGIALACVAIFLLSCSGPATNGFDALPADNGGSHQRMALDTSADADLPYGTWLYKPGNWETTTIGYPLLVFLHGSGEKGNSSSDPDVLDKVLIHGPPKMISNGSWDPPVPMFVVSPQCHDSWWNSSKIDGLISEIMKSYPIDPNNIYVTGLSMGGYGTWAWAGWSGRTITPAAIVPICGGGGVGLANEIQGIPVWAFHGSSDTTVTPGQSVNLIKAVNSLSPSVPAVLTLYSGVGHDSWTRTYEASGPKSGLGEGLLSYNPDPDVNSSLRKYDQDIYTWMLSHRAP